MRRTLFLIAILMKSNGFWAQDPATLTIGQPVPEFELKGVDGNSYNLNSFSDAQVLMVVFSANHCPTAQAYEERMNQLNSDFTNDQMQLVAISSNHPGAVCLEELGYSDMGDTFDEMKVRAKDRFYNFPYLYDGDDQKTALSFGAKATPHVFIFDKERILRYTGRIDDMEDPYQAPNQNDARNAIHALLEGKAVPVETTKAFGCSMKWKSKMGWKQKLDEQWGEKAVSVSKIDQSGIKVLVQNQGDELRLINVWATWCGPCIIEFPELVSLQRMYGQRDFEVVTISVDKPTMEEKVLSFLQEKDAAFTNYLYQSADKTAMINLIDPQWQGNLPYTLLVASGGEVVYRHDGIIDPLELKKTIVGQLGRYFADDE